MLLRLERDGPATVSALSRAEGVHPQSMGATVAALEAAGLVSGKPDSGDGRQTILSLTDGCQQWMSDGRAVRQDWLTRNIQTKLSPDEQGGTGRQLGIAQALRRRLNAPGDGRAKSRKGTPMAVTTLDSKTALIVSALIARR